MWKHLQRGMLILVAACCLILMPTVAMADDLSCSGGSPSGELFATTGQDGACSNVDPSDIANHIFSWIICSYVGILNSVLGSLYCGMQSSMTSLLGDVFTVYVVVFGIQLLMGTAQLTVKDFMWRLLKIAGVWMFVTQSAYGISLAYDFFVELATQGTSWVLNGIMSSSAFSSSNSPELQQLAQSYQSSGGYMPIYDFLDQLVYDAVVGPITEANQTVTGFFVLMIAIFPTIAALMGWYLWENFKIVARALISFMIGISALAFLISLSPIFLSLMLFSMTYHFFDNWLKYMISFSLQIVIIFACIGMWLAVTSYFIGFFDNLASVLPPSYLLEQEMANMTGINKSVALCKYNYNDPDPPNHYLPYVTQAGSCDFTAAANGQYTSSNPANSNIIPLTNMAAQATTDNNPNQSFVVYLTTNLLALLLITYAFSALLKQAPDIARQLAGPEYVPMIGQGMGFNRYGQLKGLTSARSSDSDKANNTSGIGGTGLTSGSNIRDLIDQVTHMSTLRGDPFSPKR